MNDILKVDTICDYNSSIGIETLCPLVTVVDYAQVEQMDYVRKSYGLYAVFLKDKIDGEICYGSDLYDYETNSLVFIAPGQVAGVEHSRNASPSGWALLFHPDLICNTPLAVRMKEYVFFSYEIKKALVIQRQEQILVTTFLKMINEELLNETDHHTQYILSSLIESLLNYCLRFYSRQFNGSIQTCSGIPERFEYLLDDYFSGRKLQWQHIPTTSSCAEKLHLSSNYFGMIVKKETGRSATEHIQMKLVEQAKYMMADTGKSISEVSYELGFKYPHHLSRVFKKITGQTPDEFRKLLLPKENVCRKRSGAIS